MNNILKTFLYGCILIFGQFVSAQTYSFNFNVDYENKEIKEVFTVWLNYLQTGDKKYWKESEVNILKNFNILDIEGVISPSLMKWNLNNHVLSINPYDGNRYLIKSVFQNDDKQVFAITNVIAEKIGNEYKLSNYIFEYTKDWKIEKSKDFRYIHRPEYVLNADEILKAQQFYTKPCETFDVKPEKLTYFVAKDCDEIYTILGYDWNFNTGNSKECGYFETENNFIFGTETAGANHYHEITHFINKFYPNAHSLLLTGISAYLSGEKAHFNKPLIHHTKRVNDYLELNKNIDLSKPFDFNNLDLNTNPQYVIGALLCDLILEKGGKKELINAFNSTKKDQDLLIYFDKNILKKNENLNQLLRRRINEISKTGEFPNRLK